MAERRDSDRAAGHGARDGARDGALTTYMGTSQFDNQSVNKAYESLKSLSTEEANKLLTICLTAYGDFD